MNSELGVYRSHYTRFGHAHALFFLFYDAPVISRPPKFYRLFYPKFLDLYVSMYGIPDIRVH